MSTNAAGQPLSLQNIDVSATVEQIVADFVPPPRFASVSFDNYRPDPAYPSQAAALDRLRDYVSEIEPEDRPRARFFGRWRRSTEPEGPNGIYLDGGYGVGKTHLLASAYRAGPTPKAYLTFQELAYVIGSMGMVTCLEAFKQYRLLCIDEFELDDVGNTMLAKTFVTGMIEGNGRIVTTSNTIPSDLGRGRFNAEDFVREIGRISSAFQTMRIEGEDYRHRTYEARTLSQGLLTDAELQNKFEKYQPPNRAKIYATFPELLAFLGKLHPIRYRRLLTQLDVLFIEGMAPMENQDLALRFVHLIDKLYDQGISLCASATCELPDLFLPEYRDKGYAKKYRRCLSRLHELLQESTSL